MRITGFIKNPPKEKFPRQFTETKATFYSNDLIGIDYIKSENHPNYFKEGVKLTTKDIDYLIVNLQTLKSVLESREIAHEMEKN